jgi:hypothetical protein
VVDYSIQEGDPVHQWHVRYAVLMAVLYCFGIPFTAWVALNSKKDQIQKLQLLDQTVKELKKGGSPTLSSMSNAADANKGLSENQRKKSVMHQDLLSEATRRFSGVGID